MRGHTLMICASVLNNQVSSHTITHTYWSCTAMRQPGESTLTDVVSGVTELCIQGLKGKHTHSQTHAHTTHAHSFSYNNKIMIVVIILESALLLVATISAAAASLILISLGVIVLCHFCLCKTCDGHQSR